MDTGLEMKYPDYLVKVQHISKILISEEKEHHAKKASQQESEGTIPLIQIDETQEISKICTIQRNTQTELKVPRQKRRKNGTTYWTINLITQSSRIKLIAGGSDFNFGSTKDMDMKLMMERVESSQLRFQIEYSFLEELSNFLSMDKDLRLRDTTFMQWEHWQNSLTKIIVELTKYYLQTRDFFYQK
ncbi:MAG: hypothetical protein EZS28_036554 [Streblomastix strix]|uniref:Uncharacterized protein n=1 Tax=Streblomastix strix TaxID=222440 RepID=A0A5J4UBL4_9EUKA|nr:MAG: hypothetical protein EZS28_036554 [Streblomastix strix]